MSSTLRLEWCSHRAARYAVERWHYSESLPTPPTVRIGAWEHDRFIGTVIFSRGNTPQLGVPYGLGRRELCELSRIALDEHEAPVSQVIAGAVRMLTDSAPRLRLIVSFADPHQGHLGIVYQASNWLYLGESAPTAMYRDRTGRIWHTRQISQSGLKKQYGVYRRVPKIADCERIDRPGKHRYALPLDKGMRRNLAKIAKPYPRDRSLDGETAANHAEGAGSTPAGRFGSATVSGDG